MNISRKLARISLVVAATTVAASVGVAVVLGQTGEDAAVKELDQLATSPDDVVVARVNGTPITRRAVDVTSRLALAGFSDGGSGRALGTMGPEEILDQLIENLALAQASERAGIVVTDEEVTQAIAAGIVEPLSNPDVPASLKRVIEASLRAMGTSAANARTDPAVREAYRQFLLLNRHASSTKATRQERLPAALNGASIEKVPGALPSRR